MTRRAGLVFREPSSNPIWVTRSRELCRAMTVGRSYRAAELLALGRSDCFWSADETRQVLAAAEGTLLWESAGSWWRSNVKLQGEDEYEQKEKRASEG